MNIEIYLRKQLPNSNPQVSVGFGDSKLSTSITHMTQTIKINHAHESDTELVVTRNELDLYDTGRSHHANIVFVDKIIVDDFWEINDKFYPPVSKFEKDYEAHLDKVGAEDWIKESLTHNTHLFFNGKLIWNIKYPVRRSFFKDYNR